MAANREALIDCETGQIIESGGKRLRGECRKCGLCCLFNKNRPPGVPFPDVKRRRCRHLVGTPTGTASHKCQCGIYAVRPASCHLWPELYHFEMGYVPEGCGYYYE